MEVNPRDLLMQDSQYGETDQRLRGSRQPALPVYQKRTNAAFRVVKLSAGHCRLTDALKPWNPERPAEPPDALDVALRNPIPAADV